MSDQKPPVPIADQIKEVGREIGLRRAVYPGFVTRMKMTQAEADAHLAAMEAAYATLKWVERHQHRLRQLAPDLHTAPEPQTPYDAGPAEVRAAP